jgi:hypothetical protein
MSIQQNFPSTRPSLNLNFARSQKLDPRITFTRTSSATRVNSDGLIEVVPANSPRFDFDPISGESLGLLVEEQRTNLLLRSEEFDNSYWTKTGSSIEPNVITAPDGTNTADRLIEDTSTGGHLARVDTSGLVSLTQYTVSIYAKAAQRNLISIVFGQVDLVNRCSVLVDLLDGTVLTQSASGTATQSAFVQSVGDGWHKISLTIGNVNTTTYRVDFRINATDTLQSYTGDGTSGIYIWGAQLETGAFPTSYIPTTTSTVTRTADNARIIGSNFSDFYNPSEGTVYCEANPGTVVAQRVVCDFGSNALNRITYLKVANGNAVLFATNNNNTQASIQFGPWTTNGKLCGSYKLNDFAASFNGSAVGIDTDGILPDGVNKMDIGKRADGGVPLNGHIKNISYYPSRLSNQVLQTLTK